MAANLKRVQEIDKLLKVPQYNRKINFGRRDASIEFGDRNSSLIISGSSSGVVVSGSGLFVDSNTVAAGTAADGASYLALDSNNKIIKTTSLSQIPDDTKLFFGTDNDAYIEYNENGDDFLTISGSANGIVLSGSTIQIDGTLEGASPLRLGGEIQFVSTGDAAAFNFGPNQEAKIYYEDGGTGTLVISGSSAHGTAISGSALVVRTTSGIGVGVENSDITHAITLPNNNNSTGQIKANAFVSYSSQRYKKDIQVLNNPMDVLNKINGVSFKWKDTDRLDYGFIAEDVGKVLPNIVAWENNEKDAQGMDYLKIISFLVEAVKNQQKEIDQLKQNVKY